MGKDFVGISRYIYSSKKKRCKLNYFREKDGDISGEHETQQRATGVVQAGKDVPHLKAFQVKKEKIKSVQVNTKHTLT